MGDFPPETLVVSDLCKGKRVVLLGLPGAFTPTCSNLSVPSYLAKQAELQSKGVSDVLVYSVGDSAVITAWAADQRVEGSLLTFLADPQRELAEALGLVLDDKGVVQVLG